MTTKTFKKEGIPVRRYFRKNKLRNLFIGFISSCVVLNLTWKVEVLRSSKLNVHVRIVGSSELDSDILHAAVYCRCPVPSWGCKQYDLWRACRGMFPHSAIREHFLRAFTNQVDNKQQSTHVIEILPFDFVAGFFMELSYRTDGDERVLIPAGETNSKLCAWWANHSHHFPALHDRVFVMLWPYVFYEVDVRCIPKHVVILAYEDVGYNSSGSKYQNGCGTRCIVSPYFTQHSWQGIAAYKDVFDVAETQDSAVKWNFRQSFVSRADVDEYLGTRPILLSFFGSLDRNFVVSAYRGLWQTVFNSTVASHELYNGSVLSSTDKQERFDIYRRSVFCLCVRGDTGTRAAFYEAILEGCTPVVYASDLLVYRELFGGRMRNLVEKAVLTMPDRLLRLDPNIAANEVFKFLTRSRARVATIPRLRALHQLSSQIKYSGTEIGGTGERETLFNVSPAIANTLRAAAERYFCTGMCKVSFV